MPSYSPDTGSRRLILTVAISAIALETSLLGLVAPLLPEIEERTGAGDAALGLALAAYAIPIMLISIPVGRLADRIGRRPLLLTGLVLTGVGSLLIAYSESLGVLLVGRAVQGIGSTGSWVAALTVVSDLARPGRKGEAIGFALAANSIGGIGGPALGGVAGGEISFEAPFLIVTALAAGMFTLGWFVLPRGVPGGGEDPDGAAGGDGGDEDDGDTGGTLATLLRPVVLVPASVMVAGSAFLGAIDFAVPLDLDRRLGTEETAIGLLFAAAASLDAIAAPIAGRAGDRRGRRPVAIVGVVVVGSSGVMLAALGSLAGAAVALVVFGFAQSILFGGAVPWFEETFARSSRGLAYGSLNLVFATGYTIGPLIAGGLLEAAGADAVYLTIAVICAAGATWLSTRRDGEALT
ncbi:MAG: MFS transporter [Solirubrobacterales bacterium]